MVRYILGRAGKGKTRYIFNEIAEARLRKLGNKLLLLVPEQYTLQAERDLMASLNLPGLIDVEVMSLTRLAQRVFDEAGGNSDTLIDEQGKQMAIRKSVEEVQPCLSVYQRASRLPGFIAQCSELISEFKQNQITSEELDALHKSLPEDRLLAGKIQDTLLIYQHFNKFMDQRRFMDSDDYLLLLIKKMRQVEFLKECWLWIDGFTTFSPITIKSILQLMSICRQTTITLCLDPQDQLRDQELFQLPQQTLFKFRDYCRAHGLEEQIVNVDPAPADRHRQPELLHLEKEVMAFPALGFEQIPQALSIKTCSNIYNEVDMTARTIIALARDRGWRWKDIAVVCGDIDRYGTLISRTFRRYGIPCFLDSKRSIINNPLVRLILSSIDAVQTRYRTSDIISLLKTGLTELDRDEWEELENYALQFGINGRRWKDAFKWGEEEKRDKNENIRQKFIHHLLKLEQAWSDSVNCRSMVAAIYENIMEQGVGERLQTMIMTQVAAGDWELALENAQIWNIVWEIMDQLLLLASDIDLSLEEFRQLLETGFRSYELAIIPPMVDQVLVGNIGRSKSQDVKAMFIMGCNDGIIPSNMPPEGLLNQEERSKLLACGLQLGWDQNLKTAEETFLIYNTFSKPDNYLGITYPMADVEGRALRPSLLIRQLRRAFPLLVVESDLQEDGETARNLVSTPGGTFKYLVKNMAEARSAGKIDSEWERVYHWFSRDAQWSHLLTMAEEAINYRNSPGRLPRHLLSKIYDKPIHTSVSRMERFVKCPFAHFVRFGLKAQERKNFVLQPPDLGDFFHTFLHEFSIQVHKRDGGWHGLDYNACQLLSDRTLDEIIPVYGNSILESSHRYRFLSNRLKRIGRRAVWTLAQEIQKGSFEPWAYEVRFGQGGVLPPIEVVLANGETVLVEGRIDRIDVLKDNQDIYLRVLDYKTGPQALNLSDVYYGLSLQLLVYMKAALAAYQQDSPAQPAGLFFFHVEDPLVKSDERIKEKVEALAAKELGLKGLILDDLRVIRLMDHDFEGTSTYLPVSLNKDLTLSGSSSAVGKNSFMALLRHVDKILNAIGNDLNEGRIDIEPVQIGSQTACQNCLYQSICQFDRKLPGNRYRNLRRLTSEEVLQRIENGEV